MKNLRRILIRTLFLSFGLFLISIQPVQAYVDPSVMTYAIQATAGIVIAVGTFFSLYSRKLLRMFSGKHSADARSIRQDDLYFNDPSAGTTIRALDILSPETKAALLEEETARMRAKNRPTLRTGLLLTAAISFLWMFYAPLQLYINNIQEFRFDFWSILPALCLMLGAGLVTGTIVYAICFKLSKKLYIGMVLFGLIFLIASYIQGNFLIGSLPSLDGTRFNWAQYNAERIQSLVLWGGCAIGIILLFLRFRKQNFLSGVNVACRVLLIAFCAVLLVNGISNGAFKKRESAIVSTADEFTYSKDQNLIILMLDALDSGMFRTLMEEEPEWQEIFEDFTYFPNTVGCYTYTKHAVPYILTGKWMDNTEPYISFETKAMDESPLFSMLEENGYRMGLYETELTYANDHIYRFENVKTGRYRLDSIGEFARQNFYAVWFQYMPYQLKPLLSSEDMMSNIQNRAVGSTDAFTFENNVFLKNVQEQTFNITDARCFRFIHLDGAHVPFRYDRNANVIPFDQGSYEQNIQASITVTGAYLSKLKESGVFDNSAVIVLADHGYNETGNPLLGRSNPILLIKGVQESHEMRTSEQPVSYEDLQGIYRDLCAGKPASDLIPYAEDAQRARRFLSYDYNTDTVITEYLQNGYASDFDAMTETGTVYVLD